MEKASGGNNIVAGLLAATFCFTACGTARAGCDETNTADLEAVSFDLMPFTEYVPLATAYFVIRNIGPSATGQRIYFDIYEVDANQNELAYIKMVYNDNIVQPGHELTRTIHFTPFHMSEGRHYKGVVRYACDPNPANNTLYQTAYNADVLTIFKDGFDAAADEQETAGQPGGRRARD
jgi:hypothetical protein